MEKAAQIFYNENYADEDDKEEENKEKDINQKYIKIFSKKITEEIENCEKFTEITSEEPKEEIKKKKEELNEISNVSIELSEISKSNEGIFQKKLNNKIELTDELSSSMKSILKEMEHNIKNKKERYKKSNNYLIIIKGGNIINNNKIYLTIERKNEKKKKKEKKIISRKNTYKNLIKVNSNIIIPNKCIKNSKIKNYMESTPKINSKSKFNVMYPFSKYIISPSNSNLSKNINRKKYPSMNSSGVVFHKSLKIDKGYLNQNASKGKTKFNVNYIKSCKNSLYYGTTNHITQKNSLFNIKNSINNNESNKKNKKIFKSSLTFKGKNVHIFNFKSNFNVKNLGEIINREKIHNNEIPKLIKEGNILELKNKYHIVKKNTNFFQKNTRTKSV